MADFLEPRRLLSGYVFSNVANFTAPPNSHPEAALVLGSDQNFYGTTYYGGTSNDGTVFELNNSTHDVTTITNFNSSTGANPQASLMIGADHNFYGTTVNGGTSNDGTVFEIDSSTHAFTTIVNFNSSSGTGPTAALALGADQNLYGTTRSGGTANGGTVFEIDASTHAMTTIVNFNASAGSSPSAGLVVGSDQNLYGTTYYGGSNNDGTVFEVNNSSHAFTTIFNFNSSNGAFPGSTLLLGSDQNLYGTTTSGGANSSGTAFEIAKSSHVLTTLTNFNSGNGSPVGNLILGSDQNFYGITIDGTAGSLMYELNSTTHVFTTIASLNANAGSAPLAGLVLGSDKNFYGTMYAGGAGDVGTVFEVNSSSHSVTPIFNFNSGTGTNPYGSLILGPDDNLYGTTAYTGAGTNGSGMGDGTVFELNSSTHALSSIVNFNGSTPANSQEALVLGADQNFYGTSSSSRYYDYGSVFEVNSSTHTLNTLVAFNTSSGQNPYASLLLGPDQNLYGTTENGGANGTTDGGTVFEINGTTHALTTIVSFNSSTGVYPEAGLILGSDQNYYGTTADGGSYLLNGTVFEINSSTHALTTIVKLNSSTGTNPTAALLVGPDHNFYGTAYNSGTGGYGTVFEINSTTHAVTTLVNFNASNGANPRAALTLGPDQNIYGTTSSGGSHYFGTLFEINSTTHAMSTLINFDASTGDSPFGGLLVGPDGNLYGTTSAAGTGGFGTVFELTLPQPLNVVSGTTTLAAGTGPGITLNSYSGITISSGAELSAAASGSYRIRMLIETGSLTLANTGTLWAGTLDMNNNDLDIANENLVTLTNQISQGYVTGVGGIISTYASVNDPTRLTTLGVIQNSINGTPTGSPLYGSGTALGLFDGANPTNTDVLIKYTYYGDANLDGKVDGSDYTLIDSGFSAHSTGWINGDFNYDGVVNGSDYTLIDNAFNRQGASLAAQIELTASAHALTPSAAKPNAVFQTRASFPPAQIESVVSEVFPSESDELIKRARPSTRSILLR